MFFKSIDKNTLLLVSTLLFIFVFLCPRQSNALNISSTYTTNQTIDIGYIVSINHDQTVILSDTNNSNNLLGISIKKNSSNISYNSKSSTLDIGTNGIFYGYVSNLNGSINVGDKITASIIEGVGQKATLAGRIIGVAQSSFDSSTKGSIKKYVNSQYPSVYFGEIPINVSVSDYAGVVNSNPSGIVSKFQNFSSKLFGKKIDQNRALIGLIIFAIGILIAISMISFSLVSTIKNIGRNPLARSEILRYFILILLMILAIISISLITSYVVMTS